MLVFLLPAPVAVGQSTSQDDLYLAYDAYGSQPAEFLEKVPALQVVKWNVAARLQASRVETAELQNLANLLKNLQEFRNLWVEAHGAGNASSATEAKAWMERAERLRTSVREATYERSNHDICAVAMRTLFLDFQARAFEASPRLRRTAERLAILEVAATAARHAESAVDEEKVRSDYERIKEAYDADMADAHGAVSEATEIAAREPGAWTIAQIRAYADGKEVLPKLDGARALFEEHGERDQAEAAQLLAQSLSEDQAGYRAALLWLFVLMSLLVLGALYLLTDATLTWFGDYRAAQLGEELVQVTP